MRIRPYNCCGEMNRLILGALLCVILAAPALAGPFEDALAVIAADKRGDYETVLKLLRPLAEQGDDESQYNLGVMYEDGRGVPQDYTEAVKWWRLAADQGYDDAQDNLGVMYAHGNGVPQDYVQAHKWFNLAAARASKRSNRDRATKNRDAVAAKMTFAQIAEAQMLAREWKPK